MTPMEIIAGIYIISTSVISIASVIARWTPTPKDDNIVKKIKEIIEVLSIPIRK